MQKTSRVTVQDVSSFCHISLEKPEGCGPCFGPLRPIGHNIWKSTATELDAAKTSWMYDLYIQSFNLTYTHRFGSSKLKGIDFTSGSEEERQRVN